MLSVIEWLLNDDFTAIYNRNLVDIFIIGLIKLLFVKP